MKIVFLDVKTIGEDLDLSIFDKFGEQSTDEFIIKEVEPEFTRCYCDIVDASGENGSIRVIVLPMGAEL